MAPKINSHGIGHQIMLTLHCKIMTTFESQHLSKGHLAMSCRAWDLIPDS